MNAPRVSASALLPKNTPGPHLYEIAQHLGPAYQKVSQQENYPATTRGIIGVGNYRYKTNVIRKSSIPTSLSTSAANNTTTTATTTTAAQSTTTANKSSYASARKLHSRLDDHIHDEDVALDEDLDDLDVAHLGNDIDDIEIDDTELDDSASSSNKLGGGDITCGQQHRTTTTPTSAAAGGTGVAKDVVITAEEEAW